MCTTTKPVAPHDILYQGRIYEGVTMKKPSLGDGEDYKLLYINHLHSLPSKESNLSTGNYVFKTIL